MDKEITFDVDLGPKVVEPEVYEQEPVPKSTKKKEKIGKKPADLKPVSITRTIGSFTVWKFPLKFDAVTKVDMPMGAQVLSAQLQKGTVGGISDVEQLVMWALVDEKAQTVTRHFAAIGTGHNKFFNIIQFIDTVQFRDGRLVCHVFEVEDA